MFRFSTFVLLLLITIVGGCGSDGQISSVTVITGSSNAGSKELKRRLANHGLTCRANPDLTLFGYFDELFRGATEAKLVQFQNLGFSVDPIPLTDADKLNGIEFSGYIIFDKKTVIRATNFNNYQQKWEEWSRWRAMALTESSQRAFIIQKTNGKWEHGPRYPAASNDKFSTKSPLLEQLFLDSNFAELSCSEHGATGADGQEPGFGSLINRGGYQVSSCVGADKNLRNCRIISIPKGAPWSGTPSPGTCFYALPIEGTVEMTEWKDPTAGGQLRVQFAAGNEHLKLRVHEYLEGETIIHDNKYRNTCIISR